MPWAQRIETMNSQDRAWEDAELTELEASLERELAGLEPWRPSLQLRHRIEAEAAGREPAAAEPEPEAAPAPFVARFARIRLKHVVVAAAALAALITVAVMPLWMPGKGGESGLAETGPAAGEPSGAASDQAPGGLILWDRVPGTNEPVDLHRDQIFIGGQSVNVVQPDQGPAMWRVRYQLLNRTSWKDEETGTVREQFVPEERVLFVPVRHH